MAPVADLDALAAALRGRLLSESARDAIAAAVSAQRALASQHWPEGVEVRVRMGVHTGEAEVRLDDYVGLDVHRAARICAAGHGGQVLISGSTCELVADELPQDVALRILVSTG